MAILSNSVLLIKTQTEGVDDKYETLLRKNGYIVNTVKILIFAFENLDKLYNLLCKPDDYSGLIFSSPRCVDAVFQCLKSTSLDDKWFTKDNFAVGERTHKDAFDKLRLVCQGQESGNAVNLAKVIVANKDLYDKPFLFPHGNLKTDTLKEGLNKEGLDLQGVLVYETIANPLTEKELKTVTDNWTKLPEYVVFFSPSGLNASIPYLQLAPDFKQCKLVAIGPVTGTAIINNNLKLYSTAKNPKPEDVLIAIQKPDDTS